MSPLREIQIIGAMEWAVLLVNKLTQCGPSLRLPALLQAAMRWLTDFSGFLSGLASPQRYCISYKPFQRLAVAASSFKTQLVSGQILHNARRSVATRFR